jgi:hypothetical protein
LSLPAGGGGPGGELRLRAVGFALRWGGLYFLSSLEQWGERQIENFVLFGYSHKPYHIPLAPGGHSPFANRALVIFLMERCDEIGALAIRPAGPFDVHRICTIASQGVTVETSSNSLKTSKVDRAGHC